MGQAPVDGGKLEDAPEDHGDALMKYAMLLANAESQAQASKGGSTKQHLMNIITGIIEGETRVLVSKYTISALCLTSFLAEWKPSPPAYSFYPAVRLRLRAIALPRLAFVLSDTSSDHLLLSLTTQLTLRRFHDHGRDLH